MATAGSVLSKEQLLCPICLDLFNQPVSTPCGHNFCRDCINTYWRTSDVSHCPLCKQRFYRKPDLKVNTFISEVASQFKKMVEITDEDETSTTGTKASISCDVCIGKRVMALKSCLDCFASFCEAHLEPHRVLGTLTKHHLINPLVNMQDRVCRKHEKLLDFFCSTDQTCVCQMCTKKDHKAHHTVPIGEESRVIRAQLGKTKDEVENIIESRLENINKINQTIQLSRENTEKEIEDTLQVFNQLLYLVQRGQVEAVEAISAKQTQIEVNASGLITEVEREVHELRDRSTELQRLLHSEDDLYLINNSPSVSTLPATNRPHSLDGAVYVGELRRAVRRVACQLEEAVKAEVRRLCEAEFQRARRCAVDVTLDPDTAHPKLVLTDDNKQVHHGDVALILPDNPERFYPCISVMGKEGFSSGRFYFEVQVKGKTEWDVGVALESVNRKGGSVLKPESGYWSLGMRKDQSYWVLSSTPTRLPLVEKPQVVGVYVDVEWGQVSFYNVDSAAHIYSFTGYSFSERLFPYFNPHRNHDQVNSAPLVILPVSAKRSA